MDEQRNDLIFFAPKDFKDGQKVLGRYLKKDMFLLLIFLFVGLFFVIGLLIANPYAYKIKYLFIGLGIILAGFIITLPAGINQSLYRMILEIIKYSKKPKNYVWKGRVIYDE